jgi:hypothetical protein
LPGNGTQVAGGWRGGAFDGLLSSPTNQERHGGGVTVDSLSLELGESWGSFCLAFCYGSPASQAGKSWRKVPLSCLEDFLVRWGLEKRSRNIRNYMGDLSTSGLRDSILHC